MVSRPFLTQSYLFLISEILMISVWVGFIQNTNLHADIVDEGSGPIILQITRGEYPGELLITWNTLSGNRYTLEKSGHLGEWFEVTSLVADSDFLSVTDTQLFGDQKSFWRVNAVGPNGEPLEVSDVMVTYSLSGAQSSMIFEVLASGTETVQNVLFYDGTLLLGDAIQGPDNVWAFSVQLDDSYPTARHLSATATTDQGTEETTTIGSFLLADPSKFVPLGQSDEPLYGQFVLVDGLGQLGPFQFVPEGGSSQNRNCGVRFVFPNGATLVGTGVDTSISFFEASFVRGEGDPNPISYVGTEKELPVEGLTPGVVAGAFNLPISEPIPLRWGRNWVDWYSGILAEGGWRELYVTPRIGTFSLPDQQNPTKPTVDPVTGEERLLTSFHGEWRPFSGPVLFRIPTAEPLNIYQSISGEIAVQGTVEADLPSGVTVKGSVTWREPNFEVRLEGKDITISALNSVKAVLPENPESQIPAGDSDGELDDLTETLLGYRKTMRSISVGGLTNAEPAEGDTYEPSPTPIDPVGSALEAWAWRAATWKSDREGQYLVLIQTAELVGVIEQAGLTGAAAQDLSTVLKLTHDLLLLKKHAPDMLGPDMNVINDVMNTAEGQLYATADRIITDTPDFKTSNEYMESAQLIQQIQDLMQDEIVVPLSYNSGVYSMLSYSPSDEGGTVIPFKTAIYDLYPRETLPGRIWHQGGLTPSEITKLETMDKEALLDFLEKVSEIYAHINHGGSGIPSFPFDDAVLAAENRLIQLHNQFVLAALASWKFEEIRSALAERVTILDLYKILNRELVGGLGAFTTDTVDILTRYEPLWVKWISTLDPAVRSERFFETAEVLFRIAHHSNDALLNSYLKKAWGDLRTLNDQFIKSNQVNGGCDSLYVDLSNLGYRFPHYGESFDTNHAFVMTGRYEYNELYTLNLNQAGRYLEGWWAKHVKGRPLEYHKLRGLLIEEGSSSMTFAYLRISSTDDTILGHGTLRGFKTSTGVEILKSEPSSGFVRFYQKGNRAILSDSIIALFNSAELKSILQWNQRAPFLGVNSLHVIDRAVRSKGYIDVYINTSDALTQEIAARSINILVKEIMEKIPEEHRVIARLLYMQELSKSLYPSESISRTYRDGFMEIYSLEAGVMPDVPGFIGATEAVGIDLFQYVVDIEQDGISAGVAGALKLKVTVQKTDPNNSANDFVALYRGSLFQVGAGPGGGIGKTFNSISFSSPLDYYKEDFQGVILTGQAGLNAAFGGVGGSYAAKGFFQMWGSGNKPVITLEEEYDVDEATGLQLSAGVDLAMGMMDLVDSFDEDPDLSIATNLILYEANENTEFGSVLHFEFDSDLVSSCGRTALRGFLAEYLTIIQNPMSQIQVVGYTDTVGPPLYNEQLSQRRADNVKAALLSILGDPPGLNQRIDPVGLGETPMFVATQSDGTRDINWRKVEIILNGAVKVKISASGVKLADSGGVQP